MPPSGRTLDDRPVRAGGGGPGGHDWDRGYGGGDNNSGDSPGPRTRLRRYRIGLAIGLVAVFMFFAALTSAFIVRQGTRTLDQANEYKTNWQPIQIPTLLWINTAILLLSSLTMERARRATMRSGMPAFVGPGTIRMEEPRLPWLGITVVLGVGFLIGQVMAWLELNRQGIFLATNASSSFYFMLTGIHALHLAGGIVVLLGTSFASLLRRPLESRQIATDITAWYWHFMGVLWLYILALLYFFGA